jgi:hypothetical protein
MQLKPLLECGLTLGGWIGFRATGWSGISSIPLYGRNPVPNADAPLLRDAPCSLKPCWSAGGRSAGGSAFGPLLVRDFFYPPSMGEIPGQTRTLRSLFPIPSSSLPRSSSSALKTRPLASLGNFCSLVASLDSRFIKILAGTRADARRADRLSGRCWSGISSIPLLWRKSRAKRGRFAPFFRFLPPRCLTIPLLSAVLG